MIISSETFNKLKIIIIIIIKKLQDWNTKELAFQRSDQKRVYRLYDTEKAFQRGDHNL